MRLLGAAIFGLAAAFTAQWPVPSGPSVAQEDPRPSPAAVGTAGGPVRADHVARSVSEAVPAATLTTSRPAALLAVPVDVAARTSDLIAAAAAEFGTDATRLEAVAMCESSMRADAVGDAQEIGLFQWLPRTWEWLAPNLGYSIRDIIDPGAQARLTAWAFAAGYADPPWSLWSCAR